MFGPPSHLRRSLCCEIQKGATADGVKEHDRVWAEEFLRGLSVSPKTHRVVLFLVVATAVTIFYFRREGLMRTETVQRVL